MYRNRILIVFTLLLASNSGAEESRCFLDGKYHDIPSTHPICMFYMGTESFRAERYSEAAELWKRLTNAQVEEEGYEHIPGTSNNNLGYLYFYGKGVERNESEGISFWKKAASMGNHESEFHLCKAFGNPMSSVSSTAEAKNYCEIAEQWFAGKDADKVQSIQNTQKLLSVRSFLSFE